MNPAHENILVIRLTIDVIDCALGKSDVFKKDKT